MGGRRVLRDAAAIDAQLALPVQPPLPAGQGSPTPAGAPAAIVEHTLGSARRERDEVLRSIKELEEKLAADTAKLETELAAAGRRAAPDVWNELPSGVEDMVTVAREMVRGIGAQDRSPSIEPEHQDMVQGTPDHLLQERADYAANLERIGQLEASLELIEQANTALKGANQGFKRRLGEAGAQIRDLDYDLMSARAEINSCATEVERANAEILALTEQIAGLEEKIAESQAEQATLTTALAECKAKMATEQRTAAQHIEELKDSRHYFESELISVEKQFGLYTKDSKAEVARLTDSLEESAAAERSAVEGLENSKSEVARLTAALEESTAAERIAAEGLADSKSEVARLTNEVEKRRAELEAVERGADAKLTTSQTRIQDLEREAQGMATEIKARGAEVQQLKSQAAQDQEGLERSRNLATSRGDKILGLEGKILGLEATVKDQGRALQAQSKDLASTSTQLQDKVREAASLTSQVAEVEEKLRTMTADAAILSGQLREMRADLATKSAEATSSAADVEMLAHDLHTMTRDRDSNAASAQRLAGELTVKDAEVKAKDIETSMLDKSLEAKKTLVNQLSEQLTKRTDDVVKASQRAREEAAKGDELRARLKDQTEETERISEALREQAAKADVLADALQKETARAGELDKRAQQESSKADDVTARLKSEAAKGDELRRQLDHQTKETKRISEALRERNAKVDALSDALQNATARADGLDVRVQEASSKEDDLSARIEAEAATSASKDAEARRLADECQGLTQKLEERDAAAKVMSSRLQQAEASAMALQGELQAQTTATGEVRVQVTDLQSIVAEMCAHMTGKQLDAAQWVEIWAATREQTHIPAGQPSTEYWVVGQGFGDDLEPCEPQVCGLRMLCLHLAAAIRAGEWANEAIALVDLLMEELKNEQPLPVDGLLLVVSAAVDGARVHADEILLVAIWQLAVYLHEAFPGEPRFGVQREALDEELQHSPWCQKVTQAIATASVAEMCGGEDGQLWADRGMGVVYGARINLFVAFNLQDRRIWVFRDATVDFVVIRPTTRGITIPGVEEPLLSIDSWWFTSYNKY